MRSFHPDFDDNFAITRNFADRIPKRGIPYIPQASYKRLNKVPYVALLRGQKRSTAALWRRLSVSYSSGSLFYTTNTI